MFTKIFEKSIDKVFFMKGLLILVVLFSIMSLTCRQAYGGHQVSQFGITWAFDLDYTTGRFANGDYWIVGPVTIIGIDPPSMEVDGRIINGSMVNPSPKLGRKHGYDSMLYGRYTADGDYVPDLNAARPNGMEISAANALVLQPGSSLISTISTPQTDGRTRLQTAAVLTVLDGPAPEGSFRPAYCGSDKTIKYNKSQLDYSLLASLTPVPGSPGLSVVENYFERLWLDHIPGWIGRCHHPLDNMPNYDRDVSTQLGVGVIMLQLNFTDQEKETLLVRYTQIGIDLYGVIQDGGLDNWQQDSGRKFPILFAGLMLNDPNMKGIGMKSGDYAYTSPYGPDNQPQDLLRFEEDETTFYVSQTDIDLTHSSRWSPDPRDVMKLPYEQEDMGLPEWGKIRLYDRTKINKYWETTYRDVICPAWGGFILASHIMGIKDLWNHNAIFDYEDRYMAVATRRRQTSRFVEDMWDAYRPEYGSVWTMSPTLNVIAAPGGSVGKYPNTAVYVFGEEVNLSAVADAGYKFAGWSGDLSGSETPCKITMHSNRTITANFEPVVSVPEHKK